MNYEELTGWDAMRYATEMKKIYLFHRFVRTFEYHINESGKIEHDLHPQYADLEITDEDTIKISVREGEEEITFEKPFGLIELMYKLLKQFFETGKRHIFESHYQLNDYVDFMSNIMSEEEFRIKRPDDRAESVALLLLTHNKGVATDEKWLHEEEK